MGYEEDEEELELAVLRLFKELGWETADAWGESFPGSFLGPESASVVVLRDRLDPMVPHLNPGVSEKAIAADTIKQLVQLRPPAAAVRDNRKVRNLLCDEAKVEVRDDAGNRGTVTVRFIDRDSPRRLAGGSPVQATGDLFPNRSDIVGFVNGIPLLVMELKASQGGPQEGLRRQPGPLPGFDPVTVLVNGVTILSNSPVTASTPVTSASSQPNNRTDSVRFHLENFGFDSYRVSGSPAFGFFQFFRIGVFLMRRRSAETHSPNISRVDSRLPDILDT